MIRALTLIAALALAAPAAAQSGTARAVDGDTLAIGKARIRLHGIDAPEMRQTCLDRDARAWPCGSEAKTALARMVDGRRVVCVTRDRDRYGRAVARCTVGARDLSRAMVAAGLATAYRRYSTDYVLTEAAARRDGRGIWRGSHQTPADYRRARR